MDLDPITLATFVIVTNFTPGPNNITSASMGILYGYKKSLKYLSGITVGFCLMMILSGLVSSTLLAVLPSLEHILRGVGAIYILWLAFHTFKASYTFEDDQQILLGFSKGFFLQLLNPKVIVYGLTLYSTFLGQFEFSPFLLLVSGVVFASVCFCAVSTWTLFGAAIRAYMDRPRVRQVINATLSLLLVYTAIELSGILDYVVT